MITPTQADWDWQKRWGNQLAHQREIAQYSVQAGFVRYYGVTDVLDVCCGMGNLVPYLSDRINYTGVEISKLAIKAAREIFPQKEFHEASVLEWQPPRRYEAIVCNSVNYLGDNPALLFKSWLRTRGLLFWVKYRADFECPDGYTELQKFKFEDVNDPNNWWYAGAWRKND